VRRAWRLARVAAKEMVPPPSAPSAETDYVHPPSQSLLCPVCQEVCRTPLITSVCHHSFCTGCIFQALDREAACPLCRHTLTVAGTCHCLPMHV
jgi:hypothetical protein